VSYEEEEDTCVCTHSSKRKEEEDTCVCTHSSKRRHASVQFGMYASTRMRLPYGYLHPYIIYIYIYIYIYIWRTRHIYNI